MLEQNPRGPLSVRPAAVSGRFYPESAPILKRAVEAYLADALPVCVHNPLAIIAPHAGYIYSGQICADAYNQIRHQAYDSVVILGTNHTSPRFDRIALFPGDGFETPLGVSRTDKGLQAELMRVNPDCVPDASVHAQEHSVEVQIPFVQVLFPQATIVPIVVGRPDPALCRRFGKTLAEVIKGRRVLIVASTDLSHYPSYGDAVRVDRETLHALSSMNPETFHETLSSLAGRRIANLHTEACGEGAILAAMTAALELGARGARIISYANSGDIAVGETDRVVGYGAVVFTGEKQETAIPAGPGPDDGPGAELTTEDKKALLTFARKTIRWFLDTRTVPLARGFSPNVRQPQGVFVTLKKNGQLRGCIGRIVPDAPLYRLVGTIALQSAFHDPRFKPVSANELGDIEIEMSVLTPARTVANYKDLVVGRDGVILQKGNRSAVFLPQVALEQGWSREEMLDALAMKAGLSREAWREGARFSAFQAIVFSETAFH